MTEPSIAVLGVYRLNVTDDLVAEQKSVVHGDRGGRDADDEACRAQLEATVLVEVLVENADGRFDVGDFCQPDAEVGREEWQVAWAEAFLDADGQELIQERWAASVPVVRSFRVAFFIHDWKEEVGIETSYGERTCPSPTPMPERLARLVPYEPVD